jgi:allophanate hydrolase
MTAAGGTPVEIDIAPLLDCAKLLYSGPWVAERTAAVEDLLRDKPGAIHPTVRAIVQGGVAVTGVETFKGLYALEAYRRAAEPIWDAVDVMLLPTAPTIYRLKEVLAEPIALNANLGLYTNFVNLLDMSALAVPAGFRENGTGFGVTLIGPAFADRALLALAERYLETFPMADTPPLDLTPRKPGVKLAVVGAHLAGMPLHWQLTSREARLVSATKTAPAYKLYAMAETTPPKPALIHVGDGGSVDPGRGLRAGFRGLRQLRRRGARPAGDRHGDPGGRDLGQGLRRRAPRPERRDRHHRAGRLAGLYRVAG